MPPGKLLQELIVPNVFHLFPPLTPFLLLNKFQICHFICK